MCAGKCLFHTVHLQTVVLEKTLESPLDSKEIQPVHLKGNQHWMCIGRTDAEAETTILWLPDATSWFIGKDPDVGKDWRQEVKGVIEHGIVGWHRQLNGHELEQTLGDGEGQGSPVCCSPFAKSRRWLRNWPKTVFYLNPVLSHLANSLWCFEYWGLNQDARFQF